MTGERDVTDAVAQAKRLREQARAGGLRFEAYLPPDLAVWLIDLMALMALIVDMGRIRSLQR